jgi:hypothetical protein
MIQTGKHGLSLLLGRRIVGIDTVGLRNGDKHDDVYLTRLVLDTGSVVELKAVVAREELRVEFVVATDLDDERRRRVAG